MKFKLLDIAVAMSLFLFSSSVIGQINKVTPNFGTIVHKSTPNANGVIRCHTMEVDSIMRANNPLMPTLEQEEIWLQKQIAKYQMNQQNSGENQKVVLTIPVVFHIITDGAGAENIAGTYVQAQVDQLNIDFADLAGSTYAVAADAEIQFCLAVVDPLGNPMTEPGINRVLTYGDGPFTQTTMDNTVKPGTQWNPNNYFNVWVADLSGGLLGYAQFPSSSGLPGMPGSGGAANTDGVVVLYSSVGSVATPFPGGSPYNLGRTLTHEAGHWLGLRHIWGDGNCSVDDFCADTPLSDASNAGCPNTNSCVDSYGAPWPTANPRDMVENYMDYTNDACMNTFTNDQKTRMQTVMSICPRRASLTTSPVCTPPVADDAAITSVISPTGTLCGDTFTPEVVLANYGSTTLTSCNIVYDIDGGTPLVYAWTGTLTSLSTVNVTLPAMTTTAGAHTFNVASDLPNGNTDGNPANDSNSSSFNVVIGGQTIILDLEVDCYGDEITWVVQDAGANVLYSGGPYALVQYGEDDSVAMCLNPGCYDFIISDTYGDGMAGDGVGGCIGDGTYSIYDTSGTVLASITNVDFGFQETNNFCVTAPCVDPDVPTVSASPTSVCNGNSSTLTITGNLNDATEWFVYTGSCGGTLVGSTSGTTIVVTPSSPSTTYYVRGEGACVTPGTCATVTVNVTPLDNASFSYASSAYCVNGTDPAPTVSMAGGTFTSSPAGLSLNSATGMIDVSASTPGVYTVTYTTAGTCPNSSNVSVTINALDDATFSYSGASYCISGTDPTPTITGVAGGTFISSPAGLSINAGTGTVDLSASTAGAYTITYTTPGPCTNSSNVSFTVTALDDATFNYSASSYCVNDVDPTPTANTAGGTYSSSPAGLSINSTTGTIDVSASTANTYTVTYTTGGSCSNSSNVSISINGLDDASFSYASSIYCVNGADPSPTISGLGGGTFTSSPAGLSINASTGTVDVSASTPGVYTITYTTTGACPNSSNVAMTINALDDASFSYGAPAYCISGADPTPNITGLSGGTFTSSPAGLSINASTGTIDVSASTSATYTVTYTTSGACPNSSNVSVTITASDDATFTYSASAFCVNDSDPTPTANTAGGTYTSSPAGLSINASSGTIDVSASTPNIYTVTYTTGGSCSNSSNLSVTINALDNSSFSYGAAAYCLNGTDPTPTITGLTGGVFTSSPAGLSINASTGTVDVSSSTPGVYTVTYTTNGTCPNSSNVALTINALDDATFFYSGTSYCISGSDPTPTISGLGGGTFSSSPIGLSINASTGTVDVSASTPGAYTITYTTSGTCPNSSNVSFSVTALDDATFTYGATAFCVNGTDPTPIANTAGGTYSSSPAGLSINSSTGTIDVSASTPNTYTVTYITGGSCSNSSNSSVTINALDDASFSYGAASYCENGSDPTPNITGLTGGTFTSSPAGLSINAVTGTVDVSVSTVGAYTITYTTVGTCPNSSNISFTVVASDDASFSYGASSYCVNDTDPIANISGLGGGTFTSTPAGLSINSSTGTIDVSASMPGAYTITYTTAGTCPNASNVVVTINGLDDATFTYGSSSYCVNGSDPTPTTVSPGGSYTSSPAGLVINASTGTIDVSASTPGNYTVTYTTNGLCPNSSNGSVTITALDDATFAYGNGTYCANGVDPTPVATLTGGTYSSSPAGLSINASTGTIDLSLSTPGNYTVTYTTNGACSNSSNVSVVINAADDATISYSSGAYCSDAMDPSPTVNSAGGTFSSSPAGLVLNAATGIIDVSASTPGTYIVTYTTAGTCPNSGTQTVVINAAPTAPIITANGPTTFCNGGSVQLTSSQTSGNVWSTGATSQAITAITSGAYTVTFTDANGCTATSTPITVVVNAAPNAPTITANGPTTFCDGDSVTLTSSQLSNNVWSTSETTQSIVVTTSGIYEVTYTNSNGCSATSAQLTVNVNSLPNVVLGTFADVCSYVDPIALTGGTPAGGTYSGPGVSSGVFDPSIAGIGTHTITYTYVDGNGCTNEAQSTIIVNDCAGIDELSLMGVLVYPNPASTTVTVKSTTSNFLSIRLLDAAGRLVLEAEPLSNTASIDLTPCATGSYIMEMNTELGTARTQIIKQ